MKIILIIPPSPFLKDQKVFPNLGVLRIGAFLKQKQFLVDILDLSGEEDYLLKISKVIDDDVKFVGVTSVSPQFPSAFKIGNFIKVNFPKIKTIIGGSHITMAYGSVKRRNERLHKHIEDIFKVFDYIVIGDGELAFLEILKGTKNRILDAELNEDLKINNSIYECLPYPDRGLIDIKSYNYFIDNKKTTSLMGQLGCPFNCNFCGGRNSSSYKVVRNRSEKSIISEIDYLYKQFGFEGFMFYDDELNVNVKRFNNLLNELIKYQKDNKISFSFRGYSRSDLLTEYQSKLMYEAGFRWLLIGFESGSNKMLNNMNKNTTVEQNTKAFEIARKFNLKIKALMSLGHAGESYETIKETENWLNKVRPDETDITIITLYPGSNYFDKSIWDINKKKWCFTTRNGDKLYSEDVDFLNKSCFYKSSSDQYVSYVNTDFLTGQELVNERNRLEPLFVSRVK